jgi:coniferyl-aldehyde dehydrogenase
MLNAGQICLAPDYVLVPEALLEPLVREVRSATRRMYPSLRDNPDYASIVNRRHVARLTGYVEDAADRGAEIVEVNPGDEDFEPRLDARLPLTLILNPPASATVMQEEIFGPLLPITTYGSFDEVVERVNRSPRPLALYYFGGNEEEMGRLVEGTTAGGMCINDVVVHASLESLPLGGVGASGMGHYHGFDGFREFSHAKPVYRQGRFSPMALLRPPYGDRTRRLLKWMMR